MNQDTVTKLLRPGEQILWSSMSNPGKLIDEKNKQRNTRWFIIVGAVFAVLMFLYVRACIRAGTNVFSVVTLVFVLVAGIIFLDPVTTLKRLRKVEYAITTERVIVDGREGDLLVARSQFDSPEVDTEILIHTQQELAPGSMCTVKITQADDYDLYAAICDEI
mgnify:CR=1 FL=1